MACNLRHVAIALATATCASAIGDICSPGHPDQGGCAIDGSGCAGDRVELAPYVMNVSKWSCASNASVKYGKITSYAIVGQKNTWQMQLHGPHIHRHEQSGELPPVYVFATFTNQVYRFENWSLSTRDGAPLTAAQKLVGNALAPSTGFIINDSNDPTKIKGMMIAEGQPGWLSNFSGPSKEVYKGGVEYLRNGHTKNCTQIFPQDYFHRLFGQVVNTVDCNVENKICFFSVWKFYDDQKPIWNPVAEKFANDCLYYCILERDLSKDEPTCSKTAVVLDEHGEKVCTKKGVGGVHGLEIGKADPSDPTKFDVFLVFTGKATMSNGESSMKKVAVQVVDDGHGRDLKVLRSEPYALDLFNKYAPAGWDVGGDHAWVDDSGKYVWVSCFRGHGVGVHMLDYDTGELLYSVTGLDKYMPNQYTYTSGIHGVGTLGQKGSYLAVATSSCHDMSVCIPVVPWQWPVPESEWSAGVLFMLKLDTLVPDLETLLV